MCNFSKPPQLSPTFPILCSLESVLSSTHTSALLGHTNVPTNWDLAELNKRAGITFLPLHHYDSKHGDIYGDWMYWHSWLTHKGSIINTMLLCPLGSGQRYMICVTLFCMLRESENTLTCKNCRRNACNVRVFSDSRNACNSRMSVCFLTHAMCKTCYKIWYLWQLPTVPLLSNVAVQPVLVKPKLWRCLEILRGDAVEMLWGSSNNCGDARRQPESSCKIAWATQRWLAQWWIRVRARLLTGLVSGGAGASRAGGLWPMAGIVLSLS